MLNDSNMPIRVSMQGRSFALVEGKVCPPRGDYVAYGGQFFAVSTKTGYPLSVVADIAAGQPGKIVLMAAEGVLAFLSGSGRVVHTAPNITDSGDQKNEIFYRSLVRLTLLSEHQEVVILGDIPSLGAIAFKKVELSSLTLPPVIRRSRSWLMLTLFAGLVLVGLLSGVSLRSAAISEASATVKSLEAVDAELSGVLASVNEGRAKLNSVVKPGSEASKSLMELPTPNESFLTQFYAKKSPTTNQIRVTNGNFQY